MINYKEATSIIVNSIQTLNVNDIPIEKSINYIVANDIVSDINVSSFKNSAMDGFAVAYEDIKQIPFSAPINSVSFAGDKNVNKYIPNTALKIMTGAFVPDGYDTVVKKEDTLVSENTVTIINEIFKGQNVRLPGEDIKKNDLLFSKGQLLKPFHIGLLASIGLKEISVYRKPNILVLSTGNELVESGDLLEHGQIYNSNSYTIRAMISHLCQSVQVDSILLDEPKLVEESLSKEYDIIITSGGVSAGDRDYIPKISEKIGWKKIFHKVDIKPGKPVFFAKKENQFLFGLPGNPLSTAVTCALFVIPALKKMLGAENYLTRTSKAVMSKDSLRKSGRTLIWPGRIYRENSKLTASFSNKKTSAALSALIGSDGLIFQIQKEDDVPMIEVSRWQQILEI